jgi:hypothetical protein
MAIIASGNYSKKFSRKSNGEIQPACLQDDEDVSG